MLRNLYLIATGVLATLITSPVVLVISFVRSTSPINDWLIRWWARVLVGNAGIRLRTEHPERLDPASRYVLIANHYSYLDIPCLLAAVEQPCRFFAKKSLFQIPLFGWAIARSGFIPIDRKNRRTAVESMNLAAERIKKGNTIAIFPEEGRTSTRELKPFQRGAFLLAIRSGLPIVPIAIDGTFEVLPVGKFLVNPGLVTVRIGNPIDTTQYSVRTKDELRDVTRAEIERMLGIALHGGQEATGP